MSNFLQCLFKAFRAFEIFKSCISPTLYSFSYNKCKSLVRIKMNYLFLFCSKFKFLPWQIHQVIPILYIINNLLLTVEQYSRKVYISKTKCIISWTLSLQGMKQFFLKWKLFFLLHNYIINPLFIPGCFLQCSISVVHGSVLDLITKRRHIRIEFL